jgi:hypothetical protein
MKKKKKTGPTLYNHIKTRNETPKITLLRRGHCGLNRYLYRFGAKNTPCRTRGYGNETVEHYLLERRSYMEQRKGTSYIG